MSKKTDDVEIVGSVSLGSGLPDRKKRKISGKTVLWTVAIGGAAVIGVVFVHLKETSSGPPARVAIAPPVPGKDTVGVSKNPEYRRKVSMLNDEMANMAKKTGQSSMATVGGRHRSGDTLTPPKTVIPMPPKEGNEGTIDQKTRLKLIESAKATEKILIAKQVGSILGTWSSAGSGLAVIAVAKPPSAATGKSGNRETGANPGKGPAKKKVPIISAGKILYARIVNELDSDHPGPVLAEAVGGQFDGVKFLGSMQREHSALVIRFDKVIYTDGTVDSIGAYAVSPGARLRSGLASDVDHHYLYRYGSLLASAFMQGFGQSAMYANSTSYPSAMGTPVMGFNGMTIEQQTEMGLGQAGMMLSGQAQNAFNTPTTVKVYANTPVGLLIVAETGQKMPSQPAASPAKKTAPAVPVQSMVPQPGYPMPSAGYSMPMMPMMP
jgi:intracellular multiplication protein IcmE